MNMFTETEIERLARIDSREYRGGDYLPPADAIAVMRAANGSPRLACDLASTLESEEGEGYTYESAPSWYPVAEEDGQW